MAYPKITYKNVKGKTPTKKQIGTKITIPDQNLTLKDVIETSINGFPAHYSKA